jgi:hypothetical protein
MAVASSASQFGYTCKIGNDNEPELLPQEEIYVKILNTTILDSHLKLKM